MTPNAGPLVTSVRAEGRSRYESHRQSVSSGSREFRAKKNTNGGNLQMSAVVLSCCCLTTSFQWPWAESNRRHADFQSPNDALPRYRSRRSMVRSALRKCRGIAPISLQLSIWCALSGNTKRRSGISSGTGRSFRSGWRAMSYRVPGGGVYERQRLAVARKNASPDCK